MVEGGTVPLLCHRKNSSYAPGRKIISFGRNSKGMYTVYIVWEISVNDCHCPC